ncbi:MAG: glycosyltransferase family 4 protein [Solirubrobacteraceae bacterium]
MFIVARVRILMLTQSYAPVIGGEERVVEDLGRELVRRGHSVAVATLSRDSTTRDDGIRVHRLGSAVYRLPHAFADAERRHALPGPDPETVRDLRAVVAREQPDVVHAHNWIVHSYAVLRRRLRVPLVLSLHDYSLICPTKRLFWRQRQPCDGPAIAKCVACAGGVYGPAMGGALTLGMALTVPFTRRAVDAFVPISDAVRRGCGLDERDECQVIPNFIGELPARPDAADPRLDRLPREPFILFFGDASIDKGAAHLARVYRTLTDPPPLVHVGRCFVEELRETPGVIVAGPLEHALAIEAVRRSLIVVVPSLWDEPFGLVALEAAAAGIPVIASAIGGLTDIVADGESGVLVAPGDEAELRAALQSLLADPARRERLGAGARRRAHLFGADRVVPRFESLYRLTVDRLALAGR